MLVLAGMVLLGAPAKAAPLPCKVGIDRLRADMARIWQAAPGRLGIAVRRVDCSWLVGARSDEYFPQQSVSKLWVATAFLDNVDRGRARLDDVVLLTRRDLSVFNQTTRGAILEQGQLSLSMARLLDNSLGQSDNISNARLLRAVGGPSRVRAHLEDKRLPAIRFGPGEIPMQSAIAGLEWRSGYSLGRAFEEARARLPVDHRRRALKAYLDNPVDGATPAAIVRALSLLAQGRLLSPSSTRIMLDAMYRSSSGPRRLKGGVPRGWKVYHKTGTGQSLGAIHTGYNDVGILEAPDGTRYAVAVMIAQTTSPVVRRMVLMQSVSRAVVQHHEAAIAYTARSRGALNGASGRPGDHCEPEPCWRQQRDPAVRVSQAGRMWRASEDIGHYGCVAEPYGTRLMSAVFTRQHWSGAELPWGGHVGKTLPVRADGLEQQGQSSSSCSRVGKGLGRL